VANSLWQSISTSDSQAKPPAPPLWLNELWPSVGQAFSLPDLCHRLLTPRCAIDPMLTQMGDSCLAACTLSNRSLAPR
jgi:hypothetical protein